MGFDWKLQSEIREVAKQETITIEDINKLFESFGVQSVLESKDLPHSQSLMMFLCRTDQMTVPMMQLFIDEAKKISVEDDSDNNNNNNNEFLKKQLEFALGVDYSDQEYNQVPFISVACAGTSSLPLIQLIFATCSEVCGKEWLLQQLQLGFGSNREKTKAIRWISKYARSIDIVRFVFNTFLEIGGKAALEKELDDLDRDKKSVLTDICSHESCSVELAQFIMDQYSAAGGDVFLKKHLLLEKDKISALTIVATSSCPDCVFDFFISKIGDFCGKSVLKQELGSSKTNPLTHVCKKVKAENIGRAKLMMSKILEHCGKETLSKCLQSDEMFGFLHTVLKDNQSVEMLQLLLDTAKDNFGPEFAKRYLLDEDLFAGINLLHIVVDDKESTARLELAIRITLELGGPETMEKFLRSQPKSAETRSPLHNLCGFSSGDKMPEKKLQLVFDQMLSVGGKKLLKEQLEAVHRHGFTGLHCACRMSTFADTVSCATETVSMLLEAIYNVGGNECLKRVFEIETSDPKTSNLAAFLFHEGIFFEPRTEVVEIVLAKIIDVGSGKALLRSYLDVVDKDGKPPLSFVNKNLGKFFVAVLIKLELFKGQFAKLDDIAKEKLKTHSKIDSDEWQPSDELKNRVEKVLQGAIDPNEAERRKKFEEHANAILKQAEEEAPTRKKAKEERAAATARWQKEHKNEPMYSSSIPYERMQSGSEETSPKQGCPCVVQ